MDFQRGEILAIDKPYEWTSFGVVARVRWLLTQKIQSKVKVGHAGTLDPLATGVILLCTGKATKRIEELQAHTKQYIATLKLGATTPSFDREHPEDAVFPTEHITRGLIEQTLQQFIGDIDQIPPTFSACKVEGEHAYHKARRGVDFELKPKRINIQNIEILSFDMPQLVLRVTCSKGTYIRSLARDIGRAMQSGAYLTALQRTQIGDYRLEDCLKLDDVPQWLETVEIEPSENQKDELNKIPQ